MTHFIKFAIPRRTWIIKKNVKKRETSPPFLGKTHFFLQNFNSRYLSQLMRYWNQFETSKTKQNLRLGNFPFIHFSENSTRYKLKGAEYNFSQKRVFFSQFLEKWYIAELSSTFFIQKKIKIKKKLKNNFLVDFYFIFLFFFLKNFFILEIFEKRIFDSKGSYHCLFNDNKKFELCNQMAGRGGA